MRLRAACASAIAAIIGAWLLIAPSDAASDPPEIVAIRQLYAEAQEQQKHPTTEKSVYYYRDPSDAKTSGWQRGKPPEDDESINTMATLFRVGGKVSSAVFSSGGEDDTYVGEYYFRPDGSLAFMFSDLRTFEGSVHVETRRYFDAAGKPIRTTKAIFDLATGKPLKDAQYQQFEMPIHRSVDALLRELGERR